MIDFNKMFNANWSCEESLTGFYTVSGVITPKGAKELIIAMRNLEAKSLIKSSSIIHINDSSDEQFSLGELNDFQSFMDSKGSDCDVKVIFYKSESLEKLIVFSISEIKKCVLSSLTKDTMPKSIDNFFRKETWLLEWSSKSPIEYVKSIQKKSSFHQNTSINIGHSFTGRLQTSPYSIIIANIPDNDECLPFKQIAKALLNYISLLMVSSSVSLTPADISISFDGHREHTFSINPTDVFDKSSSLNQFKEMFFWIYKLEDEKSQNFQERVEIIRNIISITYGSKSDLFSHDKESNKILKKAKSNYKIYLRSKTKEYFELRFKLEDHLDKLYANLSDEYEKLSNTFKNNLYAFFAIISTTVIFSIIRGYTGQYVGNGEISNLLLDNNISLVVSIYGFISLIMLIFSALKYSSNIKSLENKKESLELSYGRFIDTDDLNDITGSTFSTEREKNKYWSWGVSVTWLLLSLLLILNQYALRHYYDSSNSSSPAEIGATLDVHSKPLDKLESGVLEKKKLVTTTTPMNKHENIEALPLTVHPVVQDKMK